MWSNCEPWNPCALHELGPIRSAKICADVVSPFFHAVSVLGRKRPGVPLPTRRGICRGAETFAATYARESSRASHVRLLGRIWIASVRDRRSRAPALHDTSASRPFACPERHPDGCLRDAERVDALVEAQSRSLARHRPRGAVDWRRATDRDVRTPSELARGRRCLGALVAAGRDACRLRRTRTPGLAPPGPPGAEPASPLDRPELHRGRSRGRAHSR